MPSIYVDQLGILPQRADFDLYPTQRALIRSAVPHVFEPIFGWRFRFPPEDRVFRILDVGAGDGRWGEEAKNYFCRIYSHVELTGVEIRDVSKPYSYDHWYSNTDALEWKAPQTKFNLSIANPPFNISERLLRKCHAISHQVCFLLPRDFGGGGNRFLNLHREMPPYQECPSARRPSFTGDNGTGGTVYSMWHWVAGQGTPNEWLTRQFNWETSPEDIIPVALEIRHLKQKAKRDAKRLGIPYTKLMLKYFELEVLSPPRFSNPEEQTDFISRLAGYIAYIGEAKEDVQERPPEA